MNRPSPTPTPPGVSEIVFVVDLHWTEKRALELPRLDGVDLVILGGDLTNFRGPETARTIVEAIRQAGPDVLAVCGNCDRPEMESYLADEQIDLDQRCRTWRGMQVVGLSAGLPFGDLPYERTESEFEQAAEQAFADRIRQGDEGPTVFVTHQPPHGTRCDIARGQHVGSHAVRAAIERHAPDLVLCGHIHEAAAIDRIGESIVINPGPWFAGNEIRFRLTADGLRLRDPLPGD
jgi:Icc-related predicted phosphoesterase